MTDATLSDASAADTPRPAGARGGREAPSRLLYRSPHPPPSLARLAASPMLRRINLVRTLWRGRANMLELFHPEAMDRRWMISNVSGERVFTVNDADFARHLLQGNSANYAKGRFYKVIFGRFLGESSLTLEGEAWRKRRRLIAPAFNARAIRSVEGVVERHVEALLARWEEAAAEGRPVALDHDAADLTMRIAMEAFFSSALGDKADRIGELMDLIITDSGSPPFADLMNLPGWVPRRSRRNLMAWMAEVDGWMGPVIDARLATREEGEPEAPDLLDILVHARDAETGATLSRQEIRDEVMTLFAAGHETTALSFAWGLDRLAREPEWQERIAAEALAAQKDHGGPVDAAAARGAPLIAASYDEILRLYPPAYSVGRQAQGPDRFEDVDIREGDRFQVAIFMIHRNPRWWEAPEAFDPGRFLGAAGKGRHPFAHIPFGGGPRICVGLALARLEAQILLGRALARFRLSPVGPPPEPLGKITLRTRDPVMLRLDRRA